MQVHSAPQSIPRLLVLGDLSRSEFRLWWESLPETVRQRAFLGVQNSDFLPDFIVLLRSWSGEYSSSEVLTLRQRFPLAPILAVQGNWCEGETRNGTPLAGVHALEWYEFITRFPWELGLFSEGLATIWSLPPESQPEHRALFELQRPEIHSVQRGKSLHFRIESDDFDQFWFLRDFCLRTDWEGSETKVFSTWMGDSELKPDFLLFDFPDLKTTTVRRFKSLKERFPDAVCVVFLEFPRPDEWRFLKDSGCTAIFSKPFRLKDLEYFIKKR